MKISHEMIEGVNHIFYIYNKKGRKKSIDLIYIFFVTLKILWTNNYVCNSNYLKIMSIYLLNNLYFIKYIFCFIKYIIIIIIIKITNSFSYIL